MLLEVLDAVRAGIVDTVTLGRREAALLRCGTPRDGGGAARRWGAR